MAASKAVEQERCYYQAFSQLYSLLSAGLRRPVLELAEGISDGTYVYALKSLVRPTDVSSIHSALGLLKDFALRTAGQAPQDVRRSLEVEFNRLFVGPGAVPVPPYESWFVNRVNGERRLMADAAVAVQQCYREAGFVLDVGYHDLPDHMATELKFVAELSQRMGDSAALAAQDEERLILFLDHHLKLWARDFADAVLRHSENQFYQGVASLAAAVVEIS